MTTEMLEDSGIMMGGRGLSVLSDVADGLRYSGELLLRERQPGRKVESAPSDIFAYRERFLRLRMRAQERLAVAGIEKITGIHSAFSKLLSQRVFGHFQGIF